jgi:hypothetical protein
MHEESAQAAWEVPVQEMLGADGVSLSAVSVEVDGASPRPSDDTGGSLYDLVMCGAGLGMLGRAIPGDVILSPGLSSTVGLGVAGPALSGSLGFLLRSINWRWVECDAEFMCLQVATAESLLHKMLTLVGQNILHPILVSLKKERNVCLSASGLLRVLSSLLFLLLQHLSRDSANVSMLYVEVTQAWEAAAIAEAARTTVVLAAETFAQEAATARGSAMILVKDAEDQAALVEREAQERVSWVEADSVVMLASTHEEAEGFVRKIVLLKGELAEVHRAREVAEENSRSLSDVAADAERWHEDSEREH